MEQLDVFDCLNVLIASYFTDDRGCAHENREHTLIYLCSGKLEIEERGKKTVLHPGDCAFMRRDNRMWLQKKVEDNKPYRSVVLKFTRPFLREFYHTLNQQQIPADSKREKTSLRVLPSNRPGNTHTCLISLCLGFKICPILVFTESIYYKFPMIRLRQRRQAHLQRLPIRIHSVKDHIIIRIIGISSRIHDSN